MYLTDYREETLKDVITKIEPGLFNKVTGISVPIFEKIFQTFLSFFDFVELLFVKELNYKNHTNHTILEKEVNLNERI